MLSNSFTQGAKDDQGALGTDLNTGQLQGLVKARRPQKRSKKYRVEKKSPPKCRRERGASIKVEFVSTVIKSTKGKPLHAL